MFAGKLLAFMSIEWLARVLVEVLVYQKPLESIVSNTPFIKSMFLKYLVQILIKYVYLL